MGIQWSGHKRGGREMDVQRLLQQSQALLRQYRQQMQKLSEAAARSQGNLTILEERHAQKRREQAEQEAQEVASSRRQVLRRRR